MTGYEVAGLAVSAIPLLVIGLEQYKKLITKARLWRRYQDEFDRFLLDLKTQQLLFEKNASSLVKLLTNIAPHARILDEMNDLNVWRQYHPSLIRRFGNREADLIIQNMEVIFSATMDLMDDLGVEVDKKGALTIKETSRLLQAIANRTHFTINSEKRVKLLKEVKGANQSLTTMIGHMSKVELTHEAENTRSACSQARSMCQTIFLILHQGFACSSQDHQHLGILCFDKNGPALKEGLLTNEITLRVNTSSTWLLKPGDHLPSKLQQATSNSWQVRFKNTTAASQVLCSALDYLTSRGEFSGLLSTPLSGTQWRCHDLRNSQHCDVLLHAQLKTGQLGSRERLTLAVKIITGLLQSYAMPWTPNVSFWNKENIMLDKTDSNISVTASHNFQPPVEDRFVPPGFLSAEDTRQALVNIGILILELLTNTCVEDHSSYRIWSTMAHKTCSLQELVARDWLREICGSFDVIITQIVTNCLYPPLESIATLDDERYQTFIIDRILLPLETYCVAK